MGCARVGSSACRRLIEYIGARKLQEHEARRGDTGMNPLGNCTRCDMAKFSGFCSAAEAVDNFLGVHVLTLAH